MHPGGGRVALELQQRNRDTRPIRYDAGTGEPCSEGAIRVWTMNLPDEWIVMTRDLYAEFGEAEITSLLLTVPDGDDALWDHIYLARSEADFALLEAATLGQSNAAPRRMPLSRTVNAPGSRPQGVGVVSLFSSPLHEYWRGANYPVYGTP